MPKYCPTYKIICTCMTCINAECAFSSKTRAEAEVMRGVKLDRMGNEVHVRSEMTPVPKGEGDKPAAEKPRRKAPRQKADIPPFPPSGKAQRGQEGLLIALAAVAFAILVGIVAVAYIVVNILGRPEGTGRDLAEDLEEMDPSAMAEAAPADDEPMPVPRARPSEAAAGTLIAEPAPRRDTREREEALDRLAEQFRDARPDPEAGTTEVQRRATLRPREIDPEVRRQLDQLRSQGNDLVEQRNFAEAREYYREAIELFPSYYEAFNNLANTYSDEGQLEEAEPIYRQALRIEPNSPHLRFNLGLTHYRAGRYDEALREMIWVVEANPGDAEAHQMAGVSLYKLGNYAEAARFFHHAAAAAPAAAEHYYNLFVVYSRLGAPGVANGYLAQAQALDPALVSSRRARVTAGGA